MPTKESTLKYGDYKKDKRVCRNCNKIFFTQKWRHQKFCSVQCGTDYHKGKTYEERKCLYCKKAFKVEKWRKTKYCSFECAVDANRGKTKAKKVKCRGQKIRYRPERKLKDGRRIAVHRYLLEQVLERQLNSVEQVHHIDMDSGNNELSNLWLYKNARDHTIGHKSLEKLVLVLLKDGIIEFKNGRYGKGGGRGNGKNRKG